MNGFTQAKIQIKKLTWLTLGLCFALLYSCPVKRYLLLTYGNARAEESATCQFQKDVTVHCERVVYLRRPCLKPMGVVVGMAVRPSIPPLLFSLSSPLYGTADCRLALGQALLARKDAIAGSPPRYLLERRFLI
jgi:hypothetical protein